MVQIGSSYHIDSELNRFRASELILVLYNFLTNKNFPSSFGEHELIENFQSMRPALIKLYAENTNDNFYDWFSK